MSDLPMYYEIISAYENKTSESDIYREIHQILEKYNKENIADATHIIQDLTNIYDNIDYLPLNVSDLSRAMKEWAMPTDNSDSYVVLGYPENSTLTPPSIVDADSKEQALAQCIISQKPELLDMDQESYDIFLQETPHATFYDLINLYLKVCYYDDTCLEKYLTNDCYAHII